MVAPPCHAPTVDAVDTLDAIAADPELYERMVYRTNLAARPARTAPVVTEFHPELIARLASQGITDLYTHQAQAIDLLQAGTDVVVATGTTTFLTDAGSMERPNRPSA